MVNNEPGITLRPTVIADLDTLFQFQLDKEGGYMAAFMPKDPADKMAYINKYTKLLGDPTVNNQTILLDNVIVGNIAKFVMEGDAEITYWIDRKFWGQGIATKALTDFLASEPIRPIFWGVHLIILGHRKYWKNAVLIKLVLVKALQMPDKWRLKNTFIN